MIGWAVGLWSVMINSGVDSTGNVRMLGWTEIDTRMMGEDGRGSEIDGELPILVPSLWTE